MKRSSPRPPPLPISRSAARNAALLNQLATPGVGSLMTGRYLAGIGQLILALIGFCMVLSWFALQARQLYLLISENVEPQTQSIGWLGGTGAMVFVASWFWALFTSLSLMREAKRNERQS